jgi:hypothetical protein
MFPAPPTNSFTQAKLPPPYEPFNSRALTRSLQSPVELRAQSVLMCSFQLG